MLAASWCGAQSVVAAPQPVLQAADVVFMYQAAAEEYQAYGATVLAWGGVPDAKALVAARDIKFFGSVGMVTEFSRYYDRFPERYEEGLCRDLEGRPYKVPWLTDHSHMGVPYWWCCTRQPLFRQYITERVVETVKAGAYGVHIDDHLGTAGSLFLGGCFCDHCVSEFRAFLREEGKPSLVGEVEAYNFREELRCWLEGNPGKRAESHPLWNTWRIYQFRGAAAFMAQLRRTAAATAGRVVPMSANACLLWGPHLSDHQSLDFFSAEIDHHATELRLSYAPVVAYRIADAVERPLASTASGGDWAFIKQRDKPGLVRSWIALGYASGHSLMAPHRQWCYTPEQGTHWYQGPRQQFAPLYRFARDQARLLDGFRNHADLLVVCRQSTYDRDPSILMKACESLGAAHLSFGLALVGDEVVQRPFPTGLVAAAPAVLVLAENDFSATERAELTAAARGPQFRRVDEAVAAVRPAVQPAHPQGEKVRVFPRRGADRAVIHLVNWQYDAARDETKQVKDLDLQLDLAALGVPGCGQATLLAPGREPCVMSVRDQKVRVPELGLWALVSLELKQP